MLLTNRLQFFDKNGDEMNLQLEAAIRTTVIDPDDLGGYGATFNVYTNRNGSIENIEIVNGGIGYGPNTYLRFESILNNAIIFEIPSGSLTISPTNGKIQGVTYAYDNFTHPENTGFPYPAFTWKGELYFDLVSTSLIETQQIFVVERITQGFQTPPVLNSKLSFPRADETPTIPIDSYSNVPAIKSPGVDPAYGTGSVNVQQYTYNGTCWAGKNTVYGISDTSWYEVGMVFTSANGCFPEGTTITKIVDANTIEVSNKALKNLAGTPFTAYKKHLFAAGMLIKINAGPLEGTFKVKSVKDTSIYFETPSTIGEIPLTSNNLYNFCAVPVWRASLYGNEEETFLYTVEYAEDYPIIHKTNSIDVLPIDGTAANDAVPGIGFQNSISNDPGGVDLGYFYRSVDGEIDETMMSFHLGFSAETEGSYLKLFVLEDITYNYAPALIAQVSLRGEAEGQDERLGRLLQNFGTDITDEQELILRDSDVFEELPDYRLLNKKKKEMLLQGEEIWPYLGSYRGLVNIINWFGYYDLRIKEYWLNVQKGDPYEGKYKQIQIPFQLEKKGVKGQGLGMVPSKIYKKTNKFGLFYDLNKESGVLDVNGIPQTIDAFQFSNEEILIKLFALKQYLLQNFLPLNTQIVDIVGEGVYYERYAANYWNDRVEQFVVDPTREINFTADDTRIKIVDARAYDASEKAYVYEPGANTVRQFYATYNIKSVSVTSSPAVNGIPLVSLKTSSNAASPSTLWVGSCYVNARSSTYTLTGASDGGSDYLVGDIITLDGGSKRSPIRIEVQTVDVNGTILTFSIYKEGSRYISLPNQFSQSFVQSADLSGNFYYSGVGAGLKLSSSDLQYNIEGVKTRTIGKGYPVNDTLTLRFYSASTGSTITGVTYSLEKILVEGPRVGYFDEISRAVAITNEPGIPVGAPVDLVAQGFDTTWNEMTFTWDELWGASDATIYAWIDKLPFGSGIIIALEIIDQGTGYTRTPTIGFSGGDGINAAANAKLRNGKLQLIEVEVTSIVSTGPNSSRVFLATPFNTSMNTPYSLGAMVTGKDSNGNELPKPTVINNIDTVGGAYFDIDWSFTSAGPNPFNVYVHEGAVLSNQGSGYVDTPTVFTRNGHTSEIYTWDKMGQGNFYEMQWKVESEFGTTPFSYESGRGTIDDLKLHRVLLPYKGFYKVEMIAYDTDNNWTNEIKRNYLEAYMPEALASIAARFIGPSFHPGQPVGNGGVGSNSNILQFEQNCVDTWDEAFFMWDEFWGRWINPIKNWTTWKDCDISWDTLEVTATSEESRWSFPIIPLRDVHKVSAFDNLMGNCQSYDTGTSTMVVNLSPYSSNQRAQPIINGDPIFIRRGDVIIQTHATGSATYPTSNRIEFTIAVPSGGLPQSFLSFPQRWDVLREIDSTIIVEDDLYTSDNGKTLVPGQFVRLSREVQTFFNKTRDEYIPNFSTWGIPIKEKILDVSSNVIGIRFNQYAGISELQRPWVSGQIYKHRGKTDDLWFEGSLVAGKNVIFDALETPTETSWGNLGVLYINTTQGSPESTAANPLEEITPGFTEILVVIKDNVNNVIEYQQRLRVIDMYENTSNEGEIWEKWYENGSSITTLEVLTVDGKNVNDLVSRLNTISTLYPAYSAWIEYKYDNFPTRTVYTQGSTNLEIYMDFNTRPISQDFVRETATNPTGWYYDHAIAIGDFSTEVINVGKYSPNSAWTIITVNDPNHELYRTDSTFKESATDFDEDYANTHLGTKLLWNEVENLDWHAMCSQTWTTIDWNNTLYANYRFTPIDSIGNPYMQFNEDKKFNVDINFSTYEDNVVFLAKMLNNDLNYSVWNTVQRNDSTGLSKFEYDIYEISTDYPLTVFMESISMDYANP